MPIIQRPLVPSFFFFLIAPAQLSPIAAHKSLQVFKLTPSLCSQRSSTFLLSSGSMQMPYSFFQLSTSRYSSKPHIGYPSTMPIAIPEPTASPIGRATPKIKGAAIPPVAAVPTIPAAIAIPLMAPALVTVLNALADPIFVVKAAQDLSTSRQSAPHFLDPFGHSAWHLPQKLALVFAGQL